VGNDTLDGGAGLDTAVFSGLRHQYDIQHMFNGSIGLTDMRSAGPDGTDLLWNVEFLQFSDGLYASADSALRAAVSALKTTFTVQAYLSINPDVAASGLDPIFHFVRYGAAEGRAGSGVSPLQTVGRTITNGFDADYYLMNNPDVAASGMNPLDHYSAYGWREGRDPNATFDSSYYLEMNRDVATARLNPLEHYLGYGAKEGRDPSGRFDTTSYLVANADVVAAGVNPLQHFLEYGIYEGRSAWDVIA
jgi:serralysin